MKLLPRDHLQKKILSRFVRRFILVSVFFLLHSQTRPAYLYTIRHASLHFDHQEYLKGTTLSNLYMYVQFFITALRWNLDDIFNLLVVLVFILSSIDIWSATSMFFHKTTHRLATLFVMFQGQISEFKPKRVTEKLWT